MQVARHQLSALNLEETVNLQISNVFSTKKMSISILAMARQEDVKRWHVVVFVEAALGIDFICVMFFLFWGGKSFVL